MSLWTRLAQRRETKRSLARAMSEAELTRLILGGETSSGLEVDRVSAMAVGAVRACVRLLADSVASLPTILYKRLERGKERATKYPTYRLLHVAPNEEQTAFYWKETMMHHALLVGNAYSYIQRDGSGMPVALWQLDAAKMKAERVNGKKVYIEITNNGEKTYRLDQILHIPGIGYDGMQGYSVLPQIRDTIGMAMAVERYGAEFFRNYAGPGGYLALPGKLKNEEAIERLAKSWQGKHGDWGNKHKTAILEDGAEFKTVTNSPKDAMLIEAWQFLINEIARIFGVPPHLIGDLLRATFSNIEHQGIEFVTHSLRPWLVRWEQELTLRLVADSDRDTYFYEFLVDALLRGDTLTRSQAQRAWIEMGVYTPNEILEMENRNPYEGGDTHYVPMNWIPTDLAGALAEKQASPEEPAAEEPAAEEGSRELRSMRSAAARQQIAKTIQPLLTAHIARIVRKEKRDLKKLVKEHVGERTLESLGLSIDKYYQELPAYIKRDIEPVYQTFMADIKREISAELGKKDGAGPEDEDFVRAYVTVFAQRYIAHSKALLNKRIQEAIDENRDIQEELDRELDSWEERRPTDVSANEATRGSGAFAKNIYLLAGVIYLRWVAMGSKPCPFCQYMNGRIAGIQQDFAMPGDMLQQGGKDMGIQSHVGHPPLHRGCECQIVAG